MGKKAKFKAIRKIAMALPVLHLNSTEKKTVKGQELLEKGIGIVQDKAVQPSAKYVSTTPILVPANHSRLMKESYKKYGEAGVRGYVANVHAHVAKHQKPVNANPS